MAIKKDPKSGKWIAQVGSGKQGTRRKKRFDTKNEANDWLIRQQAQLLQGPMEVIESKTEDKSQAPSITFEDALELFMSNYKGRTTRYLRQLILNVTHVWKSTKCKSLDQVSYAHLSRFVRECEMGTYSINKKLQHFKAFCKFLSKEGYGPFKGIEDVSPVKHRAKGRWALSLSECVVLLETVKKKSPDIWWPIFMTFLNTGVRRKELVSLEWSDLDFDSGQIKIRSKPHIIIEGDPVMCKTEESIRAIPMNESLKEVLMSQPRMGSMVFSSENQTIRWNNFNRGFRNAMKGATISRLQELTPHVLRHTFISHLLVYGKQDIFTVSKLAGHSSIKTTQIYLHLLGGDRSKIEAVNSLPNYLQK